MYLPPLSGFNGQMAAGGRAPEASSFLGVAIGDGRPGGWSSLIGIITAITGNVLISFALNTQRYAHIRLARENERREEKEDRSPEHRNGQSQGTQQTKSAEVAANMSSRSDQEDGVDATESDPLIPPLRSRTSIASDSSGSTVRPAKESDTRPEKSYLRSPYWWLGISLMIVGEAGNFLAYGFAPASIVSPLGVVALVVNCLIAPWMLHETFRKRDGLGVLIAIGGAVTVVLSASDSNPKLAPDKIWALITTWEFETYLGITVFLILVLMAASNTEFGEKSILVDLGLVGLFGGYTALSTKGVASLLSNTLWRAITFPITYLLVLILVFTAIMQIKYINRALQRFDSTQVIPTQFVLFTISVILGSAVLYRDFERQTPDDAIKFVAGCALTFFGVWLITSGRKNDKDGDEEGLDSEDAFNLVDENGQQTEIRERQVGDARLHTVRSRTPSVVVTDNDYESQSASFDTPSPLEEHPWTGGLPTNISAIHVTSADRLPEMLTPDGNRQPPRMHATTSAPVIPTTSTLAPNRPSTPIRQRTTPYGDSPLRRLQSPSTQQQDSENTPGRRSIVDILPGPLLGPLSSSLSAIVADSLRKGIPIRPRTMERRRTSRRTVRPQRSYAGETRPNTSPHGGFPLRLTTTHEATSSREGSAGNDSTRTRGRSFSNTMADIFNVKRSRSGTIETAFDGSSEAEL